MSDINFKKLFGTRVRTLRTLAGLSQEKLAEKIGLSTKTISYIENGKNTLSFNKIPILAEGLGVPIYKLFVFTEFESNTVAIQKLLNTATPKEINVLTDIIKAILALK